MIKKLFSKERLLHLAVAVLLVGMIAYTLYHVIGSSSGNLLTTPTKSITDTETFTANAYLFREETVLTSSQNGLIYALADNDAKVSMNVPVAELRTGADDQTVAVQQARLDEIDRLIAILENSALTPGTSLTLADTYRAEASSVRLAVKKALKSGTRYSLADEENELLALLNRYQTLTGTYKDNSLLLEKLKQERAGLLSSSCTTYTNTVSSGYFYDRTYVDGFERLFSASALEEMTVEDFDLLSAGLDQGDVPTTDGYAVGKIAHGYEWYLALRLEGAALKQIELWNTYDAQFPTNTDATVTLRCEKLLTDEDRGTVAIFRCEDHPAGFLYLRKQSVKLILDSTEGYYVPSSALHTDKDGNAGVYIYEDSIVRWRRVEILYKGDGYVIAAEPDGRENYLNLNDLLITYGQNLYDGKVY